MITGHGGNIYALARNLGCSPSDIIDMSSNVNPLDPMPELVDHLKNSLTAIAALPQVDAAEIVKAFANHNEINPQKVLAGNGTTQFIFTLPHALSIKKALIIAPTYSDYQDACTMHNIGHDFFILKENNDFAADMDQLQKTAGRFDMVFLCNPNNPTGRRIPAGDIRALCKSLPGTLFVIDESYLPFVHDSHKKSLITSSLDNVIVLNSMSKIFKIPGLRIGFIKAGSAVIEKIRSYMLPWSVNALAQKSALFLMTEKETVNAFTAKTLDLLEKEKHRFINHVHGHCDLKCFNSSTSFILAKLPERLTASWVCKTLSKDKILIRNCDNFTGLNQKFIRVSLKTEHYNTLLAKKLITLLNGKRPDGVDNGI